MRQVYWEVPVLSVATLWSVAIGLFVLVEAPKTPTVVEILPALSWTAESSESKAENYAGTVALTVTPAPTKDVVLHYRVTCDTEGVESREWQRTLPAGLDTLTLPFELLFSNGFPYRENVFEQEHVTLSLTPQAGYTLGKISEHKITFLPVPRTGNPKATVSSLVEPDEVEIRWGLSDGGGAATKSFSVSYVLSGEAIEKGFYVAADPVAKKGTLDLPAGESQSQALNIRHAKPLDGKSYELSVKFQATDQNLRLAQSVLVLRLQPRPPLKYQLKFMTESLAEGSQGQLELSLSAGTLSRTESLAAQLVSGYPDDLVFLTPEGKEAASLTVSLDHDQPKQMVNVLAKTNLRGLEPDRTVQVVASVAGSDVAKAVVTILDKTPLRLQLVPPETTDAGAVVGAVPPADVVVIEGANARVLRMELADGVTVAQPLTISLELVADATKVFDPADVLKVAGVLLPRPAGSPADRLLAQAVISVEKSGVNVEMEAPENSVPDEPDRIAVFTPTAPPGVTWHPTSPRSVRVIRRESKPECTGNLLVLLVANESNTGEGSERNLVRDLKGLRNMKVPDCELLNSEVYVIDKLALRTATEILENPKLVQPFQQDPVAEMNALQSAWQKLSGDCKTVDCTCIVWVSKTETTADTDKAEQPRKPWTFPPPPAKLFFFWLGGDAGAFRSSSVVKELADATDNSHPHVRLQYATIGADVNQEIPRTLGILRKVSPPEPTP